MLLLASSVCGLFKWRQFEPEVIVLAVGWYLRFSLSYRDVEELLTERGLHADHVTARPSTFSSRPSRTRPQQSASWPKPWVNRTIPRRVSSTPTFQRKVWAFLAGGLVARRAVPPRHG